MENNQITTIRNPLLSLWQSAVLDTVIKKKGLKSVSEAHANDHMKATRSHIQAKLEGYKFDLADKELDKTQKDKIAAHYSNYHFDHALHQYKKSHEGILKKLEDDFGKFVGVFDIFREYSDFDPLWSECELTFIEYMKILDKGMVYRDWKREGKGDLNYSVIRYKIPHDVKIGLISDWGTGLDDSIALLADLLSRGVTTIIHLGDIYYSGTPSECDRICQIIKNARNELKTKNRDLQFFSIPGNHDYYSLGQGFYSNLIDSIGNGPEAKQDASYLCLRSEDGKWQFLGMDTGQDDYNPSDDLASQREPRLTESEKEWHRDKLENFNGKTILLAHHQVFSTNSAVNTAFRDERRYINSDLVNMFGPYFDKVAAWFWGHEHNLVVFEKYAGLSKGRLIGCSGFQESKLENPYVQNFPDVKYVQPMVQLATINNYYYHGYAIIDLGKEIVSYYQFPSGGPYKKSDLPVYESCLYEESL